MHLFKTSNGIILKHEGNSYLMDQDWDTLVNQPDLYQYLLQHSAEAKMIPEEDTDDFIHNYLKPPIGSQEVWAAGVTYLKSRDARIEESENAGGADYYQKVYEAKRPELFFKALPHRVAGHNQKVNIRKDSAWNVPEPELTLFINSQGKVQGYTIGNDMSSRSIEGENPLYLPQAKVYENSAAIGPCLYITNKPLPPQTKIEIKIIRKWEDVFLESTTISRIKRSFEELAAYLYNETDFSSGCYLMTGTCIVPPNNFTLQENDIIEITIDEIGTLRNFVALKNNKA